MNDLSLQENVDNDSLSRPAITESKVRLLDNFSILLFKVCLYRKISPDKKSISHYMEDFLYHTSTNRFSFFVFSCFKRDAIEFLEKEYDKYRNDKILSFSSILDLENLILSQNLENNSGILKGRALPKALKSYFEELEKEKLSEFIDHFETPEKLIMQCYHSIRIYYIVNLLKKNIGFLFFWSFIIFCVFFFLNFAAKENSFSLVQQFRLWINFILGR